MLVSATIKMPVSAAPEPPVDAGALHHGLVVAARDGNRAAFGRLHEKYAPMVHGILLARVPYGDAEDLGQEVFLKAFGRMSSLREPERFGGWLATIARNHAARFHQRRRRTQTLPENLMISDTAPDPDRRAEALRILGVIRSLPEAYRETLVLRLVEGLTGPQIAAQTGLTAGSVRVNLHRGMRLLRQELGPELESGP
jgi:RNA polymerase sigma-70 factor (ECF subfamily)